MFYLLLIGIITLVLFLWRRNFKYWEKEGIHFDKPHMLFGSLTSLMQRKHNFGTAIYDIYTKHKEPFLGIYILFRPAILVRDAAICKDMLTTSFASFHDRGVYVDLKNDPFSANLFSSKGQYWRSLRTKLTPSFTSGRLKAMFPTLIESVNNLVDHISENIPDGDKGTVFEVKDLMSRYGIDLTASSILGVENNSFKNPFNDFRMVGLFFNSKSLLRTVQIAAGFLYPDIEKVMRFFGFRDKVREFMRKIVKETVEFREKNNFMRKDLMQMLIQLRNTGTINPDENHWKVQTVAEDLKSMSMEELSGEGFIFFVASFENAANTSTYCLHELLQNPDILEALLEEINEVLKKYDSEMCYDAVKEMKLLDRCIMETNRKYPFTILNRICTENYKIPGHDYTIKKGTPIVMSLMGLHRDEEYFPNPLKFDPERFLNNNYNSAAYMPFGEGPRHCIAYRLGQMNAKVAIVKLLTTFKFECLEKREIEFDNYGATLMPKGGVNIKIFKK